MPGGCRFNGEPAGGQIPAPSSTLLTGALSPNREFAAHGLSKAALLALTRNFAVELAPAVRTNAIALARFSSGMSEALAGLARDQSDAGTWQPRRPGRLRRLPRCGPAFINGDCLCWMAGAIGRGGELGTGEIAIPAFRAGSRSRPSSQASDVPRSAIVPSHGAGGDDGR
jgi:NAD(P)-dependent dehydrogenase (short-subunit alcohol dehydrogenase family)